MKEFYGTSRNTITGFYGIKDYETGDIVNKAMLKIINKIESLDFKSNIQFKNLVKKIVYNTALDFIREKQNQKKKLKEADIQFVSPTTFSSKNIKADSDYNISENDNIEENFIEDDGVDDYLEDDFEFSKSKMEIDFLSDPEIIKKDKRISIVNDILNSFTKDDQCYLRLHLNGVSHKDLTNMMGSTNDATRQYINRLLKKFFKCVSEKLNKNYDELYENYKKQNKRFNSGESTKRREY